MDEKYEPTSVNTNYANYHSEILKIVEDNKDVKSTIVKWFTDNNIHKKCPIVTTIIVTLRQQYDMMLQFVPGDTEVKRRYDRILEIREQAIDLLDMKKGSFLIFEKQQDMTDEEEKSCFVAAQKLCVKQKTQLFYKISKSNVSIEDTELASLLFLNDTSMALEKHILSEKDQAELANRNYKDLLEFSFNHNMDQSKIFTIILQKLNDTPTMSFYYITLLKNMKFSKTTLKAILNEVDRNLNISKDISFLNTGAAFAFIAHHNLIDSKELYYMLSPYKHTDIILLNKKIEENYDKRIRVASKVKMDYSKLNYNMDVVDENTPIQKVASTPAFITASEVIEFQNKADKKIAGEIDDWEKLSITHRKLGYIWSLFRIHRYDLALPLLETLPSQLVINIMPNIGVIIGDIIMEKLKKTFSNDFEYRTTLNEIINLPDGSEKLVQIVNDLQSIIFLAGPYLGKHFFVCKRLIDIVTAYIQCKEDILSIPQQYFNLIEALVTRILIPGIAFTSSAEEYSCKLNKLLKLFPVEKRYKMYETWVKDVGVEYRSIGLAQKKVYALMKFYSNRISKDNARECFKELAPFIEDHPYEALKCMIGMIQTNDVMIPILVETLKVMTDLSLDVLGFTIYKYLNENFKIWISNDDLFSIKNVSKFVGRIVAEHGIDVSCILQFVDDKLAESNAYILYLLGEILYSFNYKISQSSLTNEQVVAMAGGEFLQKAFEISDMTKAKVDWNELCTALKNNGTFYSIYKHLSSTKLSLKELSLKTTDQEGQQNYLALKDMCQDVLNQFIHIINDELIPNSSSIDKIPSIVNLLQDNEVKNIELSWSIKRLAFWESVKRVFEKKCKNHAFAANENVDNKKHKFCKEAIIKELEKIEKSMTESDAYQYKCIPIRLYCLFWLCSVDTLIFPSSKYKEKINEIQNVRVYEDRFDDDYDRKKRKEDDAKRKSLISDLEKEQKDLKPKRRRVRKIIASLLSDVVNGVDGSRNDNGCLTSDFCKEFVTFCIMPRYQLSRYESFYCSIFVRTIHDLSSVKLSTKEILREIFHEIPMGISQYSNDECANCGLLLLKSFEISDDVYNEVKKNEYDNKKQSDNMEVNTTNESSNEKDKKSSVKNTLIFDFNNTLVSEEIFTFIYNEQDILCEHILKLLNRNEMQTHVNALTVVSEMIEIFPKFKDHCKKILEIVETRSQDPELKKTKVLPLWITILRKLKDKKNLLDGIKKNKTDKKEKRLSKNKEDKVSKKNEKEIENKEKLNKSSESTSTLKVSSADNSGKYSKRDSSNLRDTSKEDNASRDNSHEGASTNESSNRSSRTMSKDSIKGKNGSYSSPSKLQVMSNDKENGESETKSEITNNVKSNENSDKRGRSLERNKIDEQSDLRSKSSDKNYATNGDTKVLDVSQDGQKSLKQNDNVKESPSESNKHKYNKASKENDKKELSQSSDKSNLKRLRKSHDTINDKEKSSKVKKSKESFEKKRKLEKISDKKSKRKSESSQILVANGAEAITPDSPEKESFGFSENSTKYKNYNNRKYSVKRISSPDLRGQIDNSADELNKPVENKADEDKHDSKDALLDEKKKFDDKKHSEENKKKFSDDKRSSPYKNELNDEKKKDKSFQGNPSDDLRPVSISPDNMEDEKKNKSLLNKEEEERFKESGSSFKYYNKEHDRKFVINRAKITGPNSENDRNNYDSSHKRRISSYRQTDDYPSMSKKPRRDRDHSSSSRRYNDNKYRNDNRRHHGSSYH
ncbi:THO complex subunit 2 [Strongyloides ratti]|uniref:THO complex subunit 2 n=1 Tax=Strongyloides ratti TaxID=34506 RepID=A0A090LGG2_STRRB|nr:THO complex subunit 2 [Strongyloides ratti]CEF67188.1 THO complex subunit 2 [Strongyloides ratti]